MVNLMSDDKQALKAVPVRRRSAARLAAVQIIYQTLITGQSAINFAPQFLAHYAGDAAKSFKVKDLDEGHLNALYAGVEHDVATESQHVAALAAPEQCHVDRLLEFGDMAADRRLAGRQPANPLQPPALP